MNINKIHIVVGSLTLLMFLITGVFMKINFPEIYSSTEIIRYQFRANHIYILMSGLLNLVAGLYIRPDYKHWRKFFSGLSTAAIILSSIILVIAFFVEPIKASAIRPLTFSGIALIVFGVLMMFVVKFRFKN